MKPRRSKDTISRANSSVKCLAKVSKKYKESLEPAEFTKILLKQSPREFIKTLQDLSKRSFSEMIKFSKEYLKKLLDGLLKEFSKELIKLKNRNELLNVSPDKLLKKLAEELMTCEEMHENTGRNSMRKLSNCS